jgi:abhydrolase domain-containing protein 17
MASTTPFPHRILSTRMLLRALLLAAIAWTAFAALVWLFAERLIFMPPRERYALGAEMVLILFSHGNAENIEQGMDFLRALRDAGFSVLAYDYSGYGLSTGRPTERAAYADADAAYAWLTRRGVPPERIIVHGRSLGGAVAADLASRRPIGRLVLESTFTSAYRVARLHPWIPFDRFRTADKLPRVTAPVLVIHGTDDEVIRFWHGERLYALARGPKRRFWVPGATHNDLSYVAGDRYWDELRAFAASLPVDERSGGT